jgi:hypothetical protein
MSEGDAARLAGIEYMGIAGSTRECETAVIRLIQFGDHIDRVRILSFENWHSLLLTINGGDHVAVKSGFASGYGGTGPAGFAYVLQLLDWYETPVEEHDISEEMFERVNDSGLTVADLEWLDQHRPVRPSRWYRYIDEEQRQRADEGTLWSSFPHVIPLAIIDPRISDLAKSFFGDPDERLLTGYRRLEDIVRKRTRIPESGTKLFSRAFAGPESKLVWKGLDEGEQSGRANLFTGVYMAHRNRRAHREAEQEFVYPLSEFLLLNHLFILEKQALKRRYRPKSKKSAV